MSGLSFQIKIILEPAGESNGEVCRNCNQVIKGEKFAALLQFGMTEQLNIKDLKFFVCETCKEKWS
jgi:hypothetical protein